MKSVFRAEDKNKGRPPEEKRKKKGQTKQFGENRPNINQIEEGKRGRRPNHRAAMGGGEENQKGGGVPSKTSQRKKEPANERV